MTAHVLALIGGGAAETVVVTEIEDSNSCCLTCDYRGKSIRAEAGDFFEAFCVVRRELEDAGLIPFCYGASVNVYPSGMSRDMGLGRRAYRMQPGKHVTTIDLVNIFDAGPDVVPSTIDRQRQFWLDWVSSERK